VALSPEMNSWEMRPGHRAAIMVSWLWRVATTLLVSTPEGIGVVMVKDMVEVGGQVWDAGYGAWTVWCVVVEEILRCDEG
jgi:hypothetical protein